MSVAAEPEAAAPPRGWDGLVVVVAGAFWDGVHLSERHVAECLIRCAPLPYVDVGLVPYGDPAFNRASSPLKTLENLAAGRAVVATDLPAVCWLDTALVTVAGDPDGSADAVEAALAAPRGRAARRPQHGRAGT